VTNAPVATNAATVTNAAVADTQPAQDKAQRSPFGSVWILLGAAAVIVVLGSLFMLRGK